ncbi:hypothetical protein BG005_006942 [Podila minutissima]|nr:hypothetical protein BG005_006942 [Podila minutissima]
MFPDLRNTLRGPKSVPHDWLSCTMVSNAWQSTRFHHSQVAIENCSLDDAGIALRYVLKHHLQTLREVKISSCRMLDRQRYYTDFAHDIIGEDITKK